MIKARVLACCLLIFPLAGTPPPVPGSRTNPLHPSKADPHAEKPLEGELHTCAALLAAGHFQEAAEAFQALAVKAVSAGDLDLATRATSNAGACQFNLHQYQAALRSFLQAQRLALSRGDTSKEAALDANIASLYSELGEVESASRWMEFSLQAARGEERRLFLPKLQIQMAVLRADQGRMQEAEQLFRQGIEAAGTAGDMDTYALGCNRMGEAFLLAGDLARAEAPLVEAFRVRKLSHLPLDTSYHRLGRLRLAQGDLRSASSLLDRAVELASRAQNLMPTWDIYYSRGLVRLAQGRLSSALADLRIAQHLARDWRWSLPGAETARISAQGKLDQVWSALIETEGRLYLQTRDRALAEETFRSNEENRAAGLSTAASNTSLPPTWWEAVRKVEHAEVAVLSGDSPTRRLDAERARADLALIQAANEPAGAGLPHPPRDLAARVEAALPADAALFSFHLRDRDSWLWAVDREGLTFLRLPSSAEIDRQIRSYTAALERDPDEASAAAARLYATLFAGAPARVRRRSLWLLSLDQNLFQVPVAALVVHTGSQPTYVAERHVIQVIPGVLPWLECASRRSARRISRTGPSPVFLGIGDAIYNQADPRRTGDRAAKSRGSLFSLFAAGRGPELMLPRLAASAPELAACARSWRGDATLLEGAGATRARLIAELGRNPAVIHFATHFVAAAEDSSHLVFDGSPVRREAGAREMIALSLNPSGECELLTAADVAHWQVRADLVSLSGCHSAAGAALPGVGLLGLTRAFLAAGAGAVVSSLWDTPDQNGPLFSALYRSLSAGRPVDPARALNSAQREMIRAGGWFGQPRYWGAYFLVAND